MDTEGCLPDMFYLYVCNTPWTKTVILSLPHMHAHTQSLGFRLDGQCSEGRRFLDYGPPKSCLLN